MHIVGLTDDEVTTLHALVWERIVKHRQDDIGDHEPVSQILFDIRTKLLSESQKVQYE